MSEDRHLIFHFNNGARMEESFPTQIRNSPAPLMETPKRVLEADKLIVHSEQRVVVVPRSSLRHIEASSVPATALPLGAINEARIVESISKANA